MNPLDLHQLPLHDTRLIEASAGTGKTFTIANVYLRVLLERRFGVEEILVVTFTRAATEELRGRIRGRLRDAFAALQSGRCEQDTVLDGILAAHYGEPKALLHIKHALVCMDEAAIFTIHGFCQRVLKSQAFESGHLFDQTLSGDEQTLQRLSAQSLWRRHFVQVEPAHGQWMKQHWPSWEKLLSAVQSLDRPAIEILSPDPRAGLEALEGESQSLFAECQGLWQSDANAVLEDLLAAKDDYKKIGKWKDAEAHIEQLAEQWQSYFAGDWAVASLGSDIASTTRESLAKALKKSTKHTPSHPFIERWSHFLQAQSDLGDLKRAYWSARLVADWREIYQQHKAQLRLMSFDDLLLRLHQALTRPQPASEALAERLRRQYPAAMIDEFQDTDALQYGIFKRLYHGRSDLLWLMIGDPKQAIYAFRGADIFTYLKARQLTPEAQRYTLGKNWRSDARLVEAVNQLFLSKPEVFAYRDIPFIAVGSEAKPPLEALSEGAALQAALLPWEEDSTPSVEACNAQICAWLVAEVQDLLRHPAEDLCEGDIAILVNSHAEGRAVKEALQVEGIGAVINAKQGVFGSIEAEDLQRLLAVLAGDATPGKVRTLWATPLFGLSVLDLQSLDADETQLASRYQSLYEDRQHLQQHGFLAMFLALCARERLSQRLGADMLGQRALTNYLHIAELLQAAQQRLGDLAALHRWLSEQRARDALSSEEDKQLRLESDNRLVQIVTVHASKGLEYPVVFLPFVWKPERLPSKREPPPHIYHDDDYRLSVSFHSDAAKDTRQRQIDESAAEGVRKLYVALTRAKYRCYMALAPHSKMVSSNTVYQMLCESRGKRPKAIEAYRLLCERLRELADTLEGFACTQIPEHPSPARPQYSRTGDAMDTITPSARAWPHSDFQRAWRVTSFSALLDERALTHRPITSADPEAYDDPPRGLDNRAVDFQNIAEFPKGANAGTLMHTLFEEIEYSDDPKQIFDDLTRIQHHLSQAGFEADWAECLWRMLKVVRETPLFEDFSLSKLSAQQQVVEMGFHYPYDGPHLLRLAQAYDIAPEALAVSLQDGLLKGYVDLTFEWQGKFYILDYKSNYLGPTPEHYTAEALTQSMHEHHYTLQYSIYSLALCRYLRQRLSEFDYEQHFGGVVYVFLRGVGQGTSGIHWVPADDPTLRELVLSDQQCQGGSG